MRKDWYVLHALTGQEKKAADSVIARSKNEDVREFVGDCRMPTEKVSETKGGKKRVITRKKFPGYVFVQLALYDENSAPDEHGIKKILPQTWQFVRETPGVIGFVGGDRPVPLSAAEVADVFDEKTAEHRTVRPKIDFNINDEVEVDNGPFMGLKGHVCLVDPDKGKLKVEVRIFNRNVQVEVEYWQVSKVDPSTVEKKQPEDGSNTNNP
jgi:transcriptional antiterminator NusG